MVWFKVDDKLWGHPKWIATPARARALWITAGSWCGQQEKDGFVPRHMLPMLGGTLKDATNLVDFGLWDAADGGWIFHDWSVMQPDAASNRAKREAESDGGARGNHVRWHVTRRIVVSGCQFCESVPDRVPESGANPPDPTRPDPTRETTTSPSVKAPRATQLPASWAPSEDHIKRAQDTRLDAASEAIKFRAHAEEKGRTAKSWNAAFTRWLINAAEYAVRDARRPSAQPRHEQNLDVVRFVAERDGLLAPQIGAGS